MESQFRYSDEVDRSYGAAGMTIGVVVYKGADKLSSVDLDAETWRLIEFFDDHYTSQSGSSSAKDTWSTLLGQFEIEMAMAISNLLCRRIVREHTQLNASARSAMLTLMEHEGADACALEPDEVEHLFNKEYSYLHSVFSHSAVAHIADSFADRLRRQRRISHLEILDLLHPLL